MVQPVVTGTGGMGLVACGGAIVGRRRDLVGGVLLGCPSAIDAAEPLALHLAAGLRLAANFAVTHFHTGLTRVRRLRGGDLLLGLSVARGDGRGGIGDGTFFRRFVAGVPLRSALPVVWERLVRLQYHEALDHMRQHVGFDHRLRQATLVGGSRFALGR